MFAGLLIYEALFRSWALGLHNDGSDEIPVVREFTVWWNKGTHSADPQGGIKRVTRQSVSWGWERSTLQKRIWENLCRKVSLEQKPECWGGSRRGSEHSGRRTERAKFPWDGKKLVRSRPEGRALHPKLSMWGEVRYMGRPTAPAH